MIGIDGHISFFPPTKKKRKRSGIAQPAQQQEMALLLDALPAAWAAHIHGPSPQPTQLASADPADRRIFCPAPDGHLTHTYMASSTAALLALEQPPQPVLGQDLPADLRPVLVNRWDPTRPWHPRHSAGQRQVPALGPHLVGAWSDGTVDPRSWGFSSGPAHEYVVGDSASRLRALRRILAGQQDAVSPMRPTIFFTFLILVEEPSGRQHAVMSTAASGDWRRAGQPGRQLRASMHSRSSQGPLGS